MLLPTRRQPPPRATVEPQRHNGDVKDGAFSGISSVTPGCSTVCKRMGPSWLWPAMHDEPRNQHRYPADGRVCRASGTSPRAPLSPCLDDGLQRLRAVIDKLAAFGVALG